MDANQKQLSFKLIEKKEGLNIKIQKSNPALFALEFDNGYWVKGGKESRNVRKSQMTEGTDPSIITSNTQKTILSWQPWMSQPQGQRIEFVPLDFTGTPKAGSQLRMQLLLKGKPLSGQMVENNSNEQGPKTDVNGYVTVTVLKGVNRFATDDDIHQPGDPDARRLSLTAVLVFVAI